MPKLICKPIYVTDWLACYRSLDRHPTWQGHVNVAWYSGGRCNLYIIIGDNVIQCVMRDLYLNRQWVDGNCCLAYRAACRTLSTV
jgi:hypothetical protein